MSPAHEIVPECVGRKSKIIPGGKRQTQPLISDYPTFIFTGSGKSEEESEEDNRKPALAEELKKSPERKRCRKDACPPVGSSGAELHKLALPLPTNLFSLFWRQTGSSHSPSPSFQNSGGTKTQKEKRKKKVIHTVESGEKSIRKYLTRTKPKTMLKLETNTHNEHQEQFPQTEYSQGTSGETHKTREKPEAIHSPTSATKQHIYQYSEQEKLNSRN